MPDAGIYQKGELCCEEAAPIVVSACTRLVLLVLHSFFLPSGQDAHFAMCFSFVGRSAARSPLIVGLRRRQRWQRTAGLAGGGAHHLVSLLQFFFLRPLGRCLAGVHVCGFPYTAVFGSTVDTGLCQSTKVSLVTASASQQRQLCTGQSVQLPAWTRMLTCPLLMPGIDVQKNC